MATYKSEIRGVFIHEVVFGYPHDWNVIAETLAGYGIDAVYAHFSNGASRRPDAEWVNAINAFHSRGIKFHVCIAAPLEPPYNASTRLINHLGVPYSSGNCPSNSIYRAAVKENVEYIASNYDIDGVMYDYIRYDIADQCYCPVCRARFEEWLGEGTITDWTPFYTDGARWLDYAEWRTIPITELVRDIRSWILAIKPNLVFSLAAWTYFQDCPIYWRKWIGQDTGAWIKEGYLDMVAPMMYGNDLTALGANCDANLKYMTGGAEGKIPLVAFLNNDDRTPEQFKAQVDVIRSKGLDGWIIWRYGGPGVDGPFPDIRNYLSIIDMHPTFTLGNIQVSVGATQATVTWTTDSPATSKVEFGISPLFTADWSVWGDFSYWWVKYHAGTIIEDATLKTSHGISFPSTLGTNYYFRASSSDVSGIAMSPQMTTLEAPPTPPEFVTPWSGGLDEGTYRITMPAQVQVGTDIYNFKQWEDGSTNPVRTINLTSDMAITATYELLAPPPPGYHHLVIVAQNGTTNPTAGIYDIVEGTTVQVTGTPNTGYIFKHWLLDNVIAGLDPTITLAMDADHTLLAIFSPAPKFPVLQAGLGLLGIAGLVYLATRKG